MIEHSEDKTAGDLSKISGEIITKEPCENPENSARD